MALTNHPHHASASASPLRLPRAQPTPMDVAVEPAVPTPMDVAVEPAVPKAEPMDVDGMPPPPPKTEEADAAAAGPSSMPPPQDDDQGFVMPPELAAELPAEQDGKRRSGRKTKARVIMVDTPAQVVNRQ